MRTILLTHARRVWRAENQKTSVNVPLVNVFCSHGISENHNTRNRYSKLRLLPFLRFLMPLPTRARGIALARNNHENHPQCLARTLFALRRLS